MGLTAQAEEKENEAPCGNGSADAIKSCSPGVDQTRKPPCGNGSADAIKADSSHVIKANASQETANEYAGNTWQKYFMATVEEPVSFRENPSGEGHPLGHVGQPLGLAGAGEPLAGDDKYSAIALLDDDQEDEKWSERTAVITALDHQVRKIMKPNQMIMLIFE